MRFDELGVFEEVRRSLVLKGFICFVIRVYFDFELVLVRVLRRLEVERLM